MRIPATRQGAQKRHWKRHGPGLLICLSIKGALGRRGNAGRRRRGLARPFRAPGQRTSSSPFAPGTEGWAGGSSRRGRHGGGASSAAAEDWSPGSSGPGSLPPALGAAGPGPAHSSAQPARPGFAPPGQRPPSRPHLPAARAAPGRHRRLVTQVDGCLVTQGCGVQPEAGCRWGAKGQKQESSDT